MLLLKFLPDSPPEHDRHQDTERLPQLHSIDPQEDVPEAIRAPHDRPFPQQPNGYIQLSLPNFVFIKNPGPKPQ